MKLSAILLMLGMISSSATAEEKLSEGGRSPDGVYEVRIERKNMNDQPTGYGVNIHSINPEKRIFTLPEIGGYLEYGGAVERDKSFWHGSSSFVAITDQASRHSREIYVVAMSNGSPVVLKQPDFYQNALGRVNAVEVDFSSVVTPEKWDGDDLILKVYFTANNRRSYTFEVVLHLSHGPQTTPWLSLKSVKKLKEENG